MSKEQNDNTIIQPLTAVDTKSIAIDYTLYEQYLEESGLSDEQKREFLDALWEIIVAFVDLGFGVHPLQQACDAQMSPKLEMDNSMINNDFVIATTNPLSHTEEINDE